MTYLYRLHTRDGAWHYYAAPTPLEDTLAENKARKLCLRSTSGGPIFPDIVTAAVLVWP